MSSIVTKWVVLESHDIVAEDFDAAGVLRDDTIARWIDAVRLAYLDCCPVLRDTSERTGCEVRCDLAAVPGGSSFGVATTMVISAGATEFFPTSFTLAFRVRGFGPDDDVAANLTCEVSLVDPATGEPIELGNDVRDEQIALAH